MKRKVLMCMMAVFCLGSGVTAYAAPEVMPDGTVFDAEYYAQMYPDVVAELGTDAGALYQHYMTFGKAEGRLAAAGESSALSPEIQTVQPQVDEYGFYHVSDAEITYPDIANHLGNKYTDEKGRHIYTPQGVAEEQAYRHECELILAAQIANGTMKRIPVGAILAKDDSKGGTCGYGFKIIEIGNETYSQVYRDWVLEAIDEWGSDYVIQCLLDGDRTRLGFLDISIDVSELDLGFDD